MLDVYEVSLNSTLAFEFMSFQRKILQLPTHELCTKSTPVSELMSFATKLTEFALDRSASLSAHIGGGARLGAALVCEMDMQSAEAHWTNETVCQQDRPASDIRLCRVLSECC